MDTQTGRRPESAAEKHDVDSRGLLLDRIATALGHPATIFTECAVAEPRLTEAVHLLRLWSEVREPDAAGRILAFVASVIAEQD